MLLQSHGLFFIGDTYIDEITDQDHDESSKARSDASGLGWQQWQHHDSSFIGKQT